MKPLTNNMKRMLALLTTQSGTQGKGLRTANALSRLGLVIVRRYGQGVYDAQLTDAGRKLAAELAEKDGTV